MCQKKQADVEPRPTSVDHRTLLSEARLRHPSGDRTHRLSGEPSGRVRNPSGDTGRTRHLSGEMSNRRMRYVSGDSSRRAAVSLAEGSTRQTVMPVPGGSTIQTRGQTGRMAQLASSGKPVTELDVKTERTSPHGSLQQQHTSTDIWSKGASAFSTVPSSTTTNQNS